ARLYENTIKERNPIAMTIRNIDTRNGSIDNTATETRNQTTQVNTPAVNITDGASAAQAQRLQTQFLRARKSLGSTMVQQQLQHSLSLPIPLPLPRIPTPAGMVDFTKLVTVMTAAILNGLKNFGLDGIKFGVAVAEALGNGARAIKEGADGFGDLV